MPYCARSLKSDPILARAPRPVHVISEKGPVFGSLSALAAGNRAFGSRFPGTLRIAGVLERRRVRTTMGHGQKLAPDARYIGVMLIYGRASGL